LLVWSTCPEYKDNTGGDFARLFETNATVDQWLFGFDSTVNCVTQFIQTPQGLSPAGYFPGVLGANRGPSTGVSFAEFEAATPYDQMYTGEGADASLARQYFQWKGENSLTVELGASCPQLPPGTCAGTKPYPIWGDELANRVTGSNGVQFQRGLKEGGSVVAWVDELSRHAPIVNTASITDKGISLLRYSLAPWLLQNSSQVPANAPYYADRWNGLLDISRSKQTLPLFMSKPHFLDADAVLAEDVIGLQANRDAHDTSIDVEPMTGVTMRATKRLQINYQVQPWYVVSSLGVNINWYPNTAGTLGQRLTPVLWVEESAEISNSKADEFTSKVYGAQKAEKLVGLLGGIFGALMLALAVVLFFIAQKRAVREAQESIPYDGHRLSHVG